MSMTDAIGRVQQIQATIAELSPKPAPAAGAFADALAAAWPASGAAATGSALIGGGALTGDAIVAAAKQYLGVPYVFGGEDATGMDCSGLVQRALADLGVDVPRLVSGQSTLGTEVPSLAEAKPGDLIVTRGGEHIAIYVGDDRIIHAPRPGKDVRIVDVYFDDSDIVTIRRVAPDAPASAAGMAGLSGLSGLNGLSGLSGLSGLNGLAGLGGMPAMAGSTGSGAPSITDLIASAQSAQAALLAGQTR
jgi:hypothetical protein